MIRLYWCSYSYRICSKLLKFLNLIFENDNTQTKFYLWVVLAYFEKKRDHVNTHFRVWEYGVEKIGMDIYGWMFLYCILYVYILWLGYIVVRCLCRRFGYIVCFCIYVVCIYCIQYVYMYDIVCEMYVVCRRLGWIYCIFTRSHG